MKPVVRDRFVMPIVLPIAIVVILALALYGFSRILLSITPEAATATAIVVAGGVLGAAAVAAGRKQVRLSTIAAMIGSIAGFAMLAGGIALAVAGGEEEDGEGERPVVVLAAAEVEFDRTSLSVPAGHPFTLRFHNQDAGVQHNVDIFDNDAFAGEPLFPGEIVTGVTQIDYLVDSLAPGAYFFRCVVHPPMVGEMEAVEGEGPGGPGEPSGGVSVVAQDIEFDISTIELPPDVPTRIAFDNRDAGTQHNIAIFTDPELSQELFNGELITGPEAIEYEVPPLPPGDYYFVCIVHPNMNGSVVVGPAGPPEPTGST
jgi:plastocyanin